MDKRSELAFRAVDVGGPSACPFDLTEPDLAPIMALHRHGDGYITFARARDRGEDFRPLVAIRANELARYFPEFREQLLKDAYVAINADWRLRHYGPNGSPYGAPLHRTDRLRYLCAAYCDIDYYKVGGSFGQALGRVLEMQEAGELPKASIVVRSGRGMWLIYLLHDPKDPSRAPGAFPEKKEQYFRIQRAIGERLMQIGADPCARDAARYIRIPGSLHTGSEEFVQWSIWGEGGAAYSYSLTQLCEQLSIMVPMKHEKERLATTPSTSAVKRRGWVALNSRRLRDFNILRSMRGGFSRGCRNNAAMIYAWLLRVNAVSKQDAIGVMNAFGDECQPRLTPSERRDALKTGFGKKLVRMLDRTIADRLDITPYEAAQLGFPPAAKYKCETAVPTASECKAKGIMERRERIAATIAELGRIPTLREMGRRLIEAGFNGNHQTVHNDYRAIGVTSHRTRVLRAESEARQLALTGQEALSTDACI